MGKSSKKVAAAPVAVANGNKSAKKGKRGSEEAIKKVVSAKKQKLKKDEAVATEKKLVAKAVKKKDEAISSDDSESDEEMPEVEPKAKNDATTESTDNDDSEDSDEGSEEENGAAAAPKEVDSDESGSDESDSEKEKPKAKTPATQGQGSKTLFVGNLSFKVEQADVKSFFKDAGGIADVRFVNDRDGTFKGYGYVEFTTVEAAQKALELNGEELLGREVRLDIAQERGAFTPQSKGQANESTSVFIRGFDKSLDEDSIRSALEEHFGGCGDITRVSIPMDNGSVKGIAYVEFSDKNATEQALQLNESDMGGCSLVVDRANPRSDNSGRGGRGGRGGGGGGRRGGGGRGGGGGRRGGGGRFGGGRRGGRGRF